MYSVIEDSTQRANGMYSGNNEQNEQDRWEYNSRGWRNRPGACPVVAEGRSKGRQSTARFSKLRHFRPRCLLVLGR